MPTIWNVTGVDFDAQLRGQLRGGLRDLAVEVRADAAHRQRADGDREAAEDHEREQRRDAGQAHADRQPVERRGQALDRAPGAPMGYAPAQGSQTV